MWVLTRIYLNCKINRIKARAQNWNLSYKYICILQRDIVHIYLLWLLLTLLMLVYVYNCETFWIKLCQYIDSQSRDKAEMWNHTPRHEDNWKDRQGMLESIEEKCLPWDMLDTWIWNWNQRVTLKTEKILRRAVY